MSQHVKPRIRSRIKNIVATAARNGFAQQPHVCTKCPVLSVGFAVCRGLGTFFCRYECFNDWGGREHENSVPGEITKTTPSGDRTTRSRTRSASLPRI